MRTHGLSNIKEMGMEIEYTGFYQGNFFKLLLVDGSAELEEYTENYKDVAVDEDLTELIAFCENAEVVDSYYNKAVCNVMAKEVVKTKKVNGNFSTLLETYKGYNIIIDAIGYIFIENWPVCMGNKENIKKAITCSKRKITSLVKKGILQEVEA